MTFTALELSDNIKHVWRLFNNNRSFKVVLRVSSLLVSFPALGMVILLKFFQFVLLWCYLLNVLINLLVILPWWSWLAVQLFLVVHAPLV